MSTSGKKAGERRHASVTEAYLLAALSCALFSAVYEMLSHGVYSCFMIFAFAFPLLLGATPFFLLRKYGKPVGRAAANLIRAGVTALTVGSIVQGVFEIYGTTNPLTSVYWILGGLLTAAGWVRLKTPCQD